MSKLDLMHIGVIITLGIVCLVAGFFFGYKNAEAKLQTSVENQVVSASLTQRQGDDAKSESILHQTPEIIWIKPGSEPICPQTHPIKGRFGTDVNVIYNKTNKMYDRVKPDLCFMNQEYAVSVAGFVVKF